MKDAIILSKEAIIHARSIYAVDSFEVIDCDDGGGACDDDGGGGGGVNMIMMMLMLMLLILI